MKRQYFYDKQIRRYITQLIRIFSGFQVKYISRPDDDSEKGVESFRQIPCIWGNLSRMGATWLNSNSENVAAAAPLMSLYITSLTPDPDYRYSPYHQEDTHFTTKVQNDDGSYVNKPANTYKVSQHMPSAYRMEFNVDILVANTNQKLEVLEQILGLFNPGFRIQINDSPFDIGKYAELMLTNIQWTSTSVPMGTSTDVEYATLTFEVKPVFINVPSKIRKSTIIKRIVTNLSVDNTKDELELSFEDLFENSGKVYDSIVVTPTDYSFKITKTDGIYYGEILDNADTTQNWEDIFSKYGETEQGDTWIRARRTEDIDDDNYDIYMTYEKIDDNPKKIKLTMDEDSFKVPDLDAVDKIINPNKKSPSEFGNEIGTRYLLSKDIDDENEDWGIHAKEMSIIEKGTDGWFVSFDATTDNNEHYVVNLKTNDPYHYDGNIWTHYIIGTFQPKFWMFDVQGIDCQ